MNNKLIALLVLIVLSVGGVIYFLPSDEKKIRDNLDALAENSSTVAGESVIATLQKTTRATQLFTNPAAIQIASREIDREFSHKEISDHLLMMKKRLPATQFRFQDSSISILSDTVAEVTTTLRLDGETLDGQFTDAYEIDLTVEKIAGDWFFSSITVVEFMQK